MTTKTTTRVPDIEDIAVWPDGTWATIEDVRNGEYTWRSDDYEIVRYDDTDRLNALGIDLDPDPG